MFNSNLNLEPEIIAISFYMYRSSSLCVCSVWLTQRTSLDFPSHPQVYPCRKETPVTVPRFLTPARVCCEWNVSLKSGQSQLYIKYTQVRGSQFIDITFKSHTSRQTHHVIRVSFLMLRMVDILPRLAEKQHSHSRTRMLLSEPPPRLRMSPGQQSQVWQTWLRVVVHDASSPKSTTLPPKYSWRVHESRL